MKFYYLSSCSTCKRILKEINASKLELVDIKFNPVNEIQLEEMRKLTDSYESLFSRKAMKFHSLGLNEIVMTETDYKKYILLDYTFLKRPVAIVNGKIFIGNTKQNVENLKAALQGE